MRLGLLVCDHVSPEFIEVAGDYEDMFRRLFARHPEVEIVAYDAVSGEIPDDPRDCDGWITTGSRHSVNDDQPWIRVLEGFVREVAAAGVPFIGVCFGHQLLAKALGGTVERSERGWGVGTRQVTVEEEVGLGGSYRVLTSHQDQVATLPPGGRVLGWDEHCPISMIGVGETMVGIQGHPEFGPEYAAALLDARRGHLIPDETAVRALATLDQELDGASLADWIVGFLKTTAKD